MGDDAYHFVVADDTENLAMLVEASLKQAYPHATIRAFYDGAPALDYIKGLDNGARLLLVTDTTMKDMHGNELIMQARQHRPDLLAILMSGDWRNEALARQLGVPFLQKPVPLAELVRLVQDTLAAKDKQY
jgi:DNA-binding NtrC family response regulator